MIYGSLSQIIPLSVRCPNCKTLLSTIDFGRVPAKTCNCYADMSNLNTRRKTLLFAKCFRKSKVAGYELIVKLSPSLFAEFSYSAMFVAGTKTDRYFLRVSEDGYHWVDNYNLQFVTSKVKQLLSGENPTNLVAVEMILFRLKDKLREILDEAI